ncbi:Gfo/Idh/MocA family protein [Anaerococcus sp. Marseille-Q5996]|uniref:Gfo/Idh/MocA family protein n=1 Tax=Anaerococcus sp. Marseille-Q5996 TaxID=2972769 RepID=UPI0021C71E05|nr:Gfo/Idh/MocA family oxidoreductase [Anaerococcus sp. Marseille-Q5996]
MKLGILGSGKIVKEVLPVLKEIENIEVVAIAARNEEKLQNLCEEFAIEKYYLSIEALLADEQIDTVYVALPNNLHFYAMDKAIDAGKDIICEKPFTTNSYETEKIIEKAKEHEVMIVEAISHRFIPNAIEAKKIVDDLGDIKIVSLNYSQYSSRYDKFKEGIIEPVFSLESAGGALIDLNLYNVAFAVDTFGLPKDVKYFANIEKNIDTSGIVILDYDDFKISCIGSKDSAAPMINTIQGTKGTIEIPDALNSFEEFNLEVVGDDGQYSFQFNQEGKSRLYYEFVCIEEILRTRDTKKEKELLEKTRNYMEVITKARFDANIYYPSDKIL